MENVATLGLINVSAKCVNGMCSKQSSGQEQDEQSFPSGMYLPTPYLTDTHEDTHRTSGMATQAARKRKAGYDPKRQWGLQPDTTVTENGESTYVVSGHVVGTSSLFVAENIGREGQAKAKRKKEAHDSDKALMSLLSRDKEGMETVMRAKDIVQKSSISSKAKKTDRNSKPAPSTEKDPAIEKEAPTIPKRSGFSAEVVKQLGFDPIAERIGSKQQTDLAMKRKASIASFSFGEHF
jgi:minichromosome maintenance protein 10